jgi:hypothetical protein
VNAHRLIPRVQGRHADAAAERTGEALPQRLQLITIRGLNDIMIAQASLVNIV